MSYTSTSGSTMSTSPMSSLSSTPVSIQIGFTPPGRNAPVDLLPTPATRASQSSTYSFSSSTLNTSSNSRPNAYVSDEDLFGDDDVQYLIEAPPPPRPANCWAAAAQPLPPPVTFPRPRVSFRSDKKRRTSSSSKKRVEGASAAG